MSSVVFFLLALSPVSAQTSYEGATISDIEIVLENSQRNQVVSDQFESIVRDVLTDKFSTVRNREALQKLFDSKRVASARVEVVENGSPNNVRLRFVIRRTNLVDQVTINIAESVGENVSRDELLVRLNLLTTNAVISERAVQQSADAIQTYLRERGFYKATVEFSFTPPSQRDARNNVTFEVTPGAQATVERFDINIKGFDNGRLAGELKLKPGEFFSRQKLTEDLARVRRELVKDDFLAADISDPNIQYDDATNRVQITVTGNVNAKVNIRIENEAGEEIELSERTQRELLPIKREGEIDRSSIEEGRRKLVIRFQEDGYFFATVDAVCSIEPFTPEDAQIFTNSTNTACDFLDGLNLEGKTIQVLYKAELNRRFKLTELRIEGTNQLTIEDVKPILQSQEANLLGLIPRLGYGRGITSTQALDEDVRVITSLMRELGYEDAVVRARQGVSPTGEDLIITFVVREGALTRVTDVEIEGNTVFSDDRLKQVLPELVGRPYSRTRTRNGNNKILSLYAENGYIEIKSNFAKVELPGNSVPNEKSVKVVYTIEREGAKTFINRIGIIGNTNTKEKAILESVPFAPGDLLRADKTTEGERNLIQTDVFRQVQITNEPAGVTADGNARRDVLIEVQEQGTKLLTYGGGFSTDDGASGFVDFRELNLFGRLYQGGVSIRASRRQQQAQIDFTNPRFISDENSTTAYAPLTFRAAYLRDTGVTRFFRSTLDQGALGIVQRLDEEGNPIDQFGADVGEPSINRLTFNLETSRTLNRATRSLLFVRYRYEDVRLFNIDSLLVAPILQPDRNVRISGIGATFARDTRENCNNRRTLLERIRTGEDGDPCQYNASDATKGEFLSVDYQLSARFLAGNISFNKIQATYQRYFQFGQRFRKTVIAGRAIIGLSQMFQIRDRNGNGTIDEQDRTLPISERFFGGGSTNLRGFEAEQAGPRRVIVPAGQFRNRDNEPVFLNPFTIPVGGNALAVVNIEARVPVSDLFQVVPFYDGGNVFRRTGDIFRAPEVVPGDIEAANLRAIWTNTLGLGVRVKTPIGGSVAVDFGYLLNPPEFLIPQPAAPPAIFRLRQNQIHFRFTQAF